MALRYALLGLLEHDDLSGYDMVQSFESAVGYFWSASHQQIYRELGELAKRRWLSFKIQPQADRPDRKVYSITRTGHTALLDWIEKPLPARREKEPVLVKLLAAPAVPLAPLLDEVDRQLARVDERLAIYRGIQNTHYEPPPAGDQPIDRHLMLYLALRRGILATESYRQWLAETRALLVAHRDADQGQSA